MTTRVQMLALVTAGLAGAVSAYNWRKERSVAAKQSSLAGIFASVAIVLVVAPDLMFPQREWVRSVATTLSVTMSLATFVVLILSSRERRSTR